MIRVPAWAFRRVINVFPVMRRTSTRTTYIAPDWSEWRVRIPRNWKTRNYVGSIFGGTLYAGVDPQYMLMLIHRLGDEFIVWDKAASIRFKRPGRTTLYATMRVDDREVEAIKTALETAPKVDRTYGISIVDKEGTVHAEVEKVIHVRRKTPAAT